MSTRCDAPDTAITTPIERTQKDERRIPERLADRIGRRKFDMWFGDSTCLRVEGSRLEVATTSKLAADWIGSNFVADLHGIAREAIGDHATVNIRHIHPDDREIESTGHHEQGSAGRRRDTVQPTCDRDTSARRSRRAEGPAPLRHRLDDFVVGDANRLAHAAMERVADACDHDISAGPVFLYGECGLGKTHLLQGCCHRFLEKHRGSAVRYITGEMFTNEYLASVRNGTTDRFRRRYRKLDLLAIDDVHFLANKAHTQSEFLQTLQEIDLGRSRVILASDEHPRHIRSISRGLISRFMAGMVIEVRRPDRDLRIALIRQIAARMNLRLNGMAIDRLSGFFVGSIREIEGALYNLDAMVRLEGAGDGSGEVGMVLVDRLCGNVMTTGAPLRVTAIVDRVCERLTVDRGELIGKSRHKRIVLARGLIAYLAREMTTLSFPEIGRALGRTSHSTALTADRRIREQLQAATPLDVEGLNTSSLRELVEELQHMLRRRGDQRR